MRGIFWTAVLGAAVAALLSSGVLERPLFALRLALEEPPQSLPLPIVGIRQAALRDTWAAPRGNGRKHQGIDLFAPRGMPVTSTTHGIVFRVGQNQLGGNVVWILGPGRQMHYYAHLERFADWESGDFVKAGDVIGYVGNTGNARGTPPHLHYGIYTPGRGAINPFPLLARRESIPQGRSTAVDLASPEWKGLPEHSPLNRSLTATVSRLTGNSG